MNRYFKQGFAKGALLGYLLGLLISVMFLAHSVAKLQDQIDGLRQRNEVITQQLQELNRYIQYPGG